MKLYLETDKFFNCINLNESNTKFHVDNILVDFKEEITADYSRITLSLLPSEAIHLRNIRLERPLDCSSGKSVLLNGYQSWTDTREFSLTEKLTGQSPLFKPLLDHHFKLKFGSDYLFYKYKNKKGILHSHSWSYLRNITDDVDFIGSLSEHTGFTIIEYNINKGIVSFLKDCQDRTIKEPYIAFDLIFTNGLEDLCFERYFDLLNLKKQPSKTIFGWTSWYNYYNTITEEIINKCLNNFSDAKVPLSYFQIDDGYQKHIGDWLKTNDKFKGGMKRIATVVREKGYLPGLWISPFVCEKTSDLYKNHPDWVLTQSNGKPLAIGRNPYWGGDYFALDFYNKDVRSYLRHVFTTVLFDWNFELVKLDFLFAACIIPREDKTRGEIMVEVMTFLRECTKGKKLLACGVPLCAAFGKVDYCRIGTDTGLNWENQKAKFFRHREHVSTVNTIKNSIFRRHLNGYAFVNDPDVFILRKNNNNLSNNEKFTLFLINVLFGNLIFTSDDISEYDENEKAMCFWQFTISDRVIQNVIYSGELFKIIFYSQKKYFIAVCNLHDSETEIELDIQYAYILGQKISTPEKMTLLPHASIVFEDNRYQQNHSS
jgi:alpha-galactosidase